MISKSIVKYIQSLQHKKFRDEYNAFFAEGPKVVNELLHENIFECESIYCIKEGLMDFDKKLVEPLSNKINVVENFELDKISAFTKANKILAVFKKKPVPTKLDLTNKLTLVLDDIQDPGNLGTIIRTADWFGIKTIYCSAATADCYNPKVVQSTMASIGRVNMVYADIKKVLQDNAGIKKYAAVLGGYDVKALGKIAEGFLIIGNESKGISAEILMLVDEKITIERVGEAESLNAAVAAGIILFSVLRM
jgi:RNA methyltransferase, TrmH family